MINAPAAIKAQPRATHQIGIVGGGPAGLVAAIAARQAGFAVTVYEQAESFERVGGAIGIQCNGLCVLDAIGLLNRFRRCIEVTSYATMESPPGRSISHADFNELDLPHRGFAVALRYDLQELLLAAALDQGAHIRFGSRCTGVQSQSDGVILRFADGTTARSDLLLACDGIHSAVRDSLTFRVRSRATNDAYLRVVAPVPHPEPARCGEFWATDGQRAGAFPLPGGRTYVFCSVPIGRWREIRNNHLAEWVRSWESFGDPITSLIRSVNDWDNAVYDELHDIRVDPWCAERVFLVGDAAHAMTPNLGQGANCAMVDALVLVNLLSESDDWREVGRRYEQIRKPFVTRIQDVAWMGGRMAAWQSRTARTLRDSIIVMMGRVGPMRRSSMRIAAGFNTVEQPYLRAPRTD